MEVHIVRAGETLSGIAAQHHVRFWANIYLAGENDSFRARHANPNLIHAGDRLVIPGSQSIAKLESRPQVDHRLPKLFVQSTLDLCWQACAQMLFCWKHGASAEPEFARRLGADYNKPGGLKMADRVQLLSKLGMSWVNISSVNELHELLLGWGPLWVAEINGGCHAQILTGYNLLTVEWRLLDPLGKGMTITFDERGGATGGATGTATPANMSRRRSINAMVLDNLVFGYRP